MRSPEPIVAPPGDEVVFECSLNVPAEIVRWRHNGDLMSMDHSPDSAVRRSSSAHLVVKVTDEKQAGDYQVIMITLNFFKIFFQGNVLFYLLKLPNFSNFFIVLSVRLTTQKLVNINSIEPN